jgi:S-formylglutathione hydrolase FrmB
MRDKKPRAKNVSRPAPPIYLLFSSFPPIITPHTYTLSFTLHIMSGVTEKARIASFGGKLLKLSHNATTTRCEMSFNLYLPPGAVDSSATSKVPVLIYLSGLTCTAENCSEKGFFQHGASKKGIAVLYPDTSPRM